ncbi:MAG: toprim domain-containing protein [Selenomonadaceae bacterium]|nr:toprim domain-containing protein [Selenomonadaceae bacterium]
MAYFGFGFLEQWTHPNFRLEGKWVTPTRRIIIPSENHYNAVALPEDRKRIEKKYWKMHTKPMEIFNSRALSSDSNLILITEGEIDAVSIWQAFEEKISVIAILGVANWKITLLPKLDNISNKKFLILFDAEEDSRKQAENLRGELIKHGFPATCRFFLLRLT